MFYSQVPVAKNHQHIHGHLPPPPISSSSSNGGVTSVVSEPYKFEEIHIDKFVSPPEQTSINHFGQPLQHHQVSNPFLTDNGLRSIAKGSADQANTAVASQNAAAKQAAYVAKNTLAQTATQAAGTAVAVLKGKEVLLQRLEEQSAENHKVLQSELQQLQQAKRSAKAAQYAAQQALHHVSVLTAALNNAQSASELAQKSASEAAAELASQIDMVAQAKAKLEQIESQLYNARLDYEETKDAAEKATLSAQEAQLNANDAALHANFELSESAVQTIANNAGHDLAANNDHHIIVKRLNSHNSSSNPKNHDKYPKNN